MSTYKRAVITAIITLVAAFTMNAGFAQEDKESIKIANKAKIGKYLTSSDGRALYYFKKDSPGKSECSGECAKKWPVYCFRTDQISVADGLATTDFGMFHRAVDDRAHLTYKDKPLYNYTGDKKPGDTKGHGLNGMWFVVAP